MITHILHACNSAPPLGTEPSKCEMILEWIQDVPEWDRNPGNGPDRGRNPGCTSKDHMIHSKPPGHMIDLPDAAEFK